MRLRQIRILGHKFLIFLLWIEFFDLFRKFRNYGVLNLAAKVQSRHRADVNSEENVIMQ